MRLEILNGMPGRKQPMQGFSRVTPNLDYSINGFSRVNVSSVPVELQGLMLSGLRLSGYGSPDDEAAADLQEYCELCTDFRKIPTAQGYGKYMMQGKAERQARRAKRRAARAAKKGRKSRRDEARTLRKEKGEGFLSTLKSVAGDVFGRDSEDGFDITDYSEFAEGIIPGSQDFISSIPGLGGDDKEKGYLLGKVPFEPWTGKWWKSKRVPMWQKGAIIAGGAVAVDQLVLKGQFTNPLMGKKKRK